jgi:hypothetical protein
MDATDITNMVNPYLLSATRRERRTPRYKVLVAAWCWSQLTHLPQSQACPRTHSEHRKTMELFLEAYDDQHFKDTFVFSKAEFTIVANKLTPYLTDAGVDFTVHPKGRIKAATREYVDVHDAVGLVLARLATRETLKKGVASIFGRNIGTVSSIINVVLQRWFPLLERYFDFSIFRAQDDLARKYVQAIQEALGGQYPHHRVAVLTDGSIHETAKPTWGQECAYSGKDKTHGVNHLALRGPDGLCVFLEAPREGRAHDAACWHR